jgi:NitT/TauT family transport system substrate-binding protein
VAKVWYRIVEYLNNPATHADAVKSMADRVNLPPEEYESFIEGTKILSLDEAKKAFAKGSGLNSIYGSSTVVDQFNVENKVYEKSQTVADYIEPSITEGL